MCAETISSIARELILAGRLPETPVAIIRWGTFEHQEVFTLSLEEIAETDSEIAPPAIAVVGDVVSLREKLRWFDHQNFPLRSMQAV
jgi:siroheme synthase